MANYEATKYDFSGANLQGVEGVNTGLIVPWSSTSVPSGFLECNGAAVSRTTYSALFAIIGTTYGVGDGSTTFNVPDLQERCCRKDSPTSNLGTTAGSATVSVVGNITTTVSPHTLSTPELPNHGHPAGRAAGNMRSPGVNPGASVSTSGSAGGSGAHTHNVSSESFTGDAISTLQQTLTLIYIIKT